MNTTESSPPSAALSRRYLPPPASDKSAASVLTHSLSAGNLPRDNIAYSGSSWDRNIHKPLEKASQAHFMSEKDRNTSESPQAGTIGQQIILVGKLLNDIANLKHSSQTHAQAELKTIFTRFAAEIRSLDLQARTQLLLKPTEGKGAPFELALINSLNPVDRIEGAIPWNQMAHFFRLQGLDSGAERGQRQLSALILASMRVDHKDIKEELAELLDLIRVSDPNLQTVVRLRDDIKAISEQDRLMNTLHELEFRLSSLPLKVQQDSYETLSDATFALNGAKQRSAFDRIEWHFHAIADARLQMIRENHSPPSLIKWSS